MKFPEIVFFWYRLGAVSRHICFCTIRTHIPDMYVINIGNEANKCKLRAVFLDQLFFFPCENGKLQKQTKSDDTVDIFTIPILLVIRFINLSQGFHTCVLRFVLPRRWQRQLTPKEVTTRITPSDKHPELYVSKHIK